MRTALVTGTSRGVGRGVATALASAGFKVFATGRSIASADLAKAATDKMTADMAHELRDYGVSVVSLYPGLVRTESVLAAAREGFLDLTNSESPEFIGRVIAALHRDPGLPGRSGSVVVAAQAALGLGVPDTDGTQPAPLNLAAVAGWK